MSRRDEIEMSSARSLLGRKQLTDSDSDGEEDEFDEADEDDEVLIQEQKSVTLWEDILKSLYQARFTAPLLAILGVVFAYQLTIAPYRTDTPGVSTANDMNELVRNHARCKKGCSDFNIKNTHFIFAETYQTHAVRRDIKTHSGHNAASRSAKLWMYNLYNHQHFFAIIPLPIILDFVLNANCLHTLVDNQIEMPAPYGGSFNMRFVPVVDKHGTHELPDMFYEGVMFGISHGNSHNVEVNTLLLCDGFYGCMLILDGIATVLVHRSICSHC